MITAKEARKQLSTTHMPLSTKDFLYAIENRLNEAISRKLCEFTVNVPTYLSKDALDDAKYALEQMGFKVQDRFELGLLDSNLYQAAKRYLILSY